MSLHTKNDQELAHLRLRLSEKKVLSVLSDKGKLISNISNQTKTPRMTVYSALSSLSERKLAEAYSVGGRRYWIKLANTDVTKVNQAQIKIYSGKEELFLYLKRFLSNIKGKRLLGIQPTKSALLGAEVLGSTNLATINSIIKKNKIVVEGILGEGFFKLLSSRDPNWAKYYRGRSSAITILRESLFPFETEVYMCSDRCVFINWGGLKLFEIKDEKITETLWGTMKLLCEMGQKIDVEKEIGKYS